MKFKGFFLSLRRILTAGWFITLLGLTALALLIWFGGPLIAIAGVSRWPVQRPGWLRYW